MDYISLGTRIGLTVRMKKSAWSSVVWVSSNLKHLENSSRWLMNPKASLGMVLDFANSAS